MKLKYLVVTRYTSGLKNKLKDVRELMLTAPAIDDVVFDIKEANLGKPDTYNDSEKKVRITEQWFEKNISKEARPKGYDGAIFLYSMRDGSRWRVDSGLRGSTFRDDDGFGEMWVKGDKNSKTRYRVGPVRDRIAKTIAHEIAHDMKHRGFTTLEIHDFDYKDSINNIEGFWLKFVLQTDKPSLLKQLQMNLARLLGIRNT